jgi:hypothetical protein
MRHEDRGADSWLVGRRAIERRAKKRALRRHRRVDRGHKQRHTDHAITFRPARLGLRFMIPARVHYRTTLPPCLTLYIWYQRRAQERILRNSWKQEKIALLQISWRSSRQHEHTSSWTTPSLPVFISSPSPPQCILYVLVAVFLSCRGARRTGRITS